MKKKSVARIWLHGYSEVEFEGQTIDYDELVKKAAVQLSEDEVKIEILSVPDKDGDDESE